MGRPAPAPGGEAVGKHAHDVVELPRLEVPVGPGTAKDFQQLPLVTLAGADLGDDLLGEDVEGFLRRRHPCAD